MALEHDGSLYACDHYVYSKYKLGNILDTAIAEMVSSSRQRKFSTDKLDTLPKVCRECDVRFACHGECPKHRFTKAPDGEPGLNYLCRAYKKFFHHAGPYMQEMAHLLRQGRPAALIMDRVRQRDQQREWDTVTRNDACPCASGKKFKVCCMRKGRG
jgi:uncharacterized protein